MGAGQGRRGWMMACPVATRSLPLACFFGGQSCRVILGRRWFLGNCLTARTVPGGNGELCLYKRGEEFSIRLDRCELMNSRIHGSEDALAELACARVAGRCRPLVLIGGLGMGYTPAAALHRLRADGRLVVAELVPAVVKWNRGPLADLAGRPLEDDAGHGSRDRRGGDPEDAGGRPTMPSCWTWITAPRV